MEEDDLVDPVQELRTEVLPERLGDLALDAVRQLALDLSRPGAASATYRRPRFDVMITMTSKSTVRPSPSSQPAVVEELQQDVQHFRVCLFDFVEEQRRYGRRRTASVS